MNPLSRKAVVNYLSVAGRRYWPQIDPDLLLQKEQTALAVPVDELGRQHSWIALPDWARDLGIADKLLVDRAAIIPGPGPEHARCDWWWAAFAHLAGTTEERWERTHGPTHSYRFRLKGVPDALFDRAWACRIMLLIRRAAARRLGREERELFGDLPKPRIEISHDLDALHKTTAVRLKQTLFEAVNAARAGLAREWPRAASELAHAWRFATRNGTYDQFDALVRLAAEAGLPTVWHVHGGKRRTVRQHLIDPGYDVDDPRLDRATALIRAADGVIGIHGSFESWNDADRLAGEIAALSRRIGAPIDRGRQHWLRFSFRDTWRVQAQAGLRIDATLGFNDVPGFRTGTALRCKPWDHQRQTPHDIEVVPMVLMDAHLYSYLRLTGDQRRRLVAALLDEIVAVRGEASVLWHPHTLSSDYGWGQGLLELYAMILDRGFAVGSRP